MKMLFHFGAVCVVCILVSSYAFYDSVFSVGTLGKKSSPPYPSGSFDNLFWFVQVSDIHVSKFLDPRRAPDFLEFCSYDLSIINPDLVLVTGDLVDAKDQNRIGSKQFVDEWKTYFDVINNSNVTKKYIWLDIRGNHDAFDVMHVDQPDSNYYLKYSGDRGRLSSSVYHHKKSFGIYSFMPIDATMIPGPKRPFNFAGYLTEERMKKLREESEECVSSNMSIWYGHYPSSTVTSPPPGIRSIIGKRGGFSLSGHLHTLGGLAPRMYASNKHGFMELELGDWMNSRRFRVVAIDHDLLSFTDNTHREWPLIVITNPKAAKFMMPRNEPIGRISKSSHIRFLIFNPRKLKQVEILIDGKIVENKPKQIDGGPLWVCKWTPSLYNKGTHDISITVVDVQGNKKVQTHQFSLDSTWNADFDLFSLFVLRTDFCTVFLYGFIITSICNLFSLIVLRCRRVQSNGCLAELSLFLKDDATFSVLFLFSLNLFIGPMFVGELLDGNVGICFPYGLLINGELLPECMLYLYGVIIIFLFFIPSILFLAHWNYQDKVNCVPLHLHKLPAEHRFWYACLRLLYLLYMFMQYRWCLAIYLAYGLMASIISPSRTWWFLYVLYKTFEIFSRSMHRTTTS